MARSRTRTFLTADTTTLGTRWVHGSPLPPTVYKCSSPYRESCVDELHMRKRTKGRSVIWKSGGPFTLVRSKFTRTNSEEFTLETGLNRFSGKFCEGQAGNNPSLGSDLVDPNSLNAKGATGIARSKPGKPVLDLGVAIAELRQLPTVPNLQKAVKNLSGLGNQYLNVEFGWKPLLNDVMSLFDLSEVLTKRLNQLRRDNGRAVRRRITVSQSHSTNVVTGNGVCKLYPILLDGFYDSSVPLAQRFTWWNSTTSSSRYWFSGRFRYWIPNLETPEGIWNAKRKLLGLNLTPSLLYNITPWSWLADWMSNLGDVIDNFSTNAADNLVMEYGYVMGTYSQVVSYGSMARLNNGKSAYASARLEKVVKRRAKANPYAFSVIPFDPSVRQAAILAALGVSFRSSRR